MLHKKPEKTHSFDLNGCTWLSMKFLTDLFAFEWSERGLKVELDGFFVIEEFSTAFRDLN
jgi:hypothetical protein